MEQLYLVTDPNREHVEKVTRSTCSYLGSRGCGCTAQGENPAEGSRPYKYTGASRIPERTECVITLGDDGTLIQTARGLAGRQTPIIGISLGTLGYLIQTSRQEDITQMLNDLMNDQCRMGRRMMLKGSVYQDGEKIYEGLTLNEIVLTRREMFRVLKFRVCINEDCLNEYTADGMIVVTPAGSTVYDLSAGSPVMELAVRMTILTLIYPRALNVRNIMLPAEDRIEIEMAGSDDGGQVAVYSGDAAWGMKPGDRIKIGEAEAETLLIKLKHISFLDDLREKMIGV